MRGTERLQLDVALIDRPHKEDSLADMADPIKNSSARSNISGVELTLELAKALPDLRIPTGVIVAARTLGSRTGEIPAANRRRNPRPERRRDHHSRQPAQGPRRL